MQGKENAGDFTGYGLQMSVEKQIERATQNKDDEIVPVLRSIKRLLEEMEGAEDEETV